MEMEMSEQKYVLDENGYLWTGKGMTRYIVATIGNTGDPVETKDNREFIVRACNNHDALVKALNDQADFMKWLESVGKREVSATYSEIHAEAHRRSAAMSAALAAATA